MKNRLRDGGVIDKNSERPTDTSEYITLGMKGGVSGPTLPMAIHSHCFIKINETTAYLLGKNNFINFPCCF